MGCASSSLAMMKALNYNDSAEDLGRPARILQREIRSSSNDSSDYDDPEQETILIVFAPLDHRIVRSGLRF